MVSIHHDNAVNIISAGVNVYVSDVLRSHRWYSDILGLKMELSPDELCSQYSESRSADDQGMTVFRLLPRPVGTGALGNVQLAFSVPNLEQTIEALRAVGAACTRKRSIERGCAVPSVSVLDPDGNGIVLYQM